jgi:hypothetical protein
MLVLSTGTLEQLAEEVISGNLTSQTAVANLDGGRCEYADWPAADYHGAIHMLLLGMAACNTAGLGAVSGVSNISTTLMSSDAIHPQSNAPKPGHSALGRSTPRVSPLSTDILRSTSIQSVVRRVDLGDATQH